MKNVFLQSHGNKAEMLLTNLHCGGLIKFEGFGLPILHVDLKHIGQKEKGVSLWRHMTDMSFTLNRKIKKSVSDVCMHVVTEPECVR